MTTAIPDTIRKVADTLILAGGHPYLVGGAVISLIRNQPVKDWDIEVFGMSYAKITKFTATIPGAHVDLIGSKFGVVKIRLDGEDIELTVPRRDNKTGPKHQDFDVELVPELPLEEAARRRDFTINAISYSLRDHTYHDPFDGRDDLRLGKIHYIDKEHFREDPLRAFRALQLVARKGRSITVGTIQLLSDMVEDCRHLTGEAILGELTKLLMLSGCPSVGLRYLRPKFADEPALIDLFPELKKLVGCPQRAEHHPEGDVWEHTLLVIDEAAHLKNEVPKDWQLAYMFGCLLHDVGKPDALDPKTLTMYQHDIIGGPLAETFMRRLTNNEDLIEKVVKIVSTHMRPLLLERGNSKKSGWRRLHNKCPLNILAYVALADHKGRGKINNELPEVGQDYDSRDNFFHKCLNMWEEMGEPVKTIEPVLMGRHLITAGHTPGITFSPMLAKAYEHQIETGCEDPEELLKVAQHGIPEIS